jgi:hypothetical protein
VESYLLNLGRNPKVPADTFVYYKKGEVDSSFNFSEKVAV